MPAVKKTTFKSGHYTAGVGKTLKTRDPRCSSAMSKWKSGGKLTHELAQILAGCRSQARKLSGGTSKAKPSVVATRVKERISKVEDKSEVSTKPKTIEIAGRAGSKISVEADKVKFIGKKVATEEASPRRQSRRKNSSCCWRRRLAGYEEYDAHANKGGKNHYIEVKTKLSGKKQHINMHPDALHRKVKLMNSDKSGVFHTVIADERHRFQGGAHKENYSGYDLYYKRGAGEYLLG